QRAHDRHEPIVEKLADDQRVDALDVSDEPEVHHLAGAFHAYGRTPVRADEARIDAAHAHRIDRQLAADREDPRVDEAAQNHGGHLDRALVGHAASLHHARRHTERLGDLGELRAAAVYQHDPHAEVVQNPD